MGPYKTTSCNRNSQIKEKLIMNLKYVLLVIEVIVGNKAKGRISKRVLQRKHSMPNFPKNGYFLPPDTHT